MTYAGHFILFLCIISFGATAAKFNKLKPAEYLLWSKESKLNLDESCPAVDFIVIEGAEVRTDDDGKTFSLHLSSLGRGNNRPLSHMHRFANGKKRGAVWPDYVDATQIGSTLTACRNQRKTKMLLKISLDSKYAINFRQVILLASISWNSFLSKAPVDQDRAFGKDFAFDGIHLIHNQLTTKAAEKFIQRLHEFAAVENRKDLVILSENVDSDLHLNAADANVIDSKIAENFTNPFVILAKSTDCLNPKIAKSKNYRGTIRASVLKRRRFLSFNKSKPASQGEIFMIAVILGAIFIGLVTAFVFIRSYLKRKFGQEKEEEK